MNGDLLLQIGAGGAFALLIIKEVRHWTISILNKKNSGKSPRCANFPEVKESMKQTMMIEATANRTETKVNEISKDASLQVSYLKRITEVLERREHNGQGRK